MIRVKDKLAQLEALAQQVRAAAEEGDNELAHMQEDSLRKLALEIIAEGTTAHKRVATLALSTADLNFTRWMS